MMGHQLVTLSFTLAIVACGTLAAPYFAHRNVPYNTRQIDQDFLHTIAGLQSQSEEETQPMPESLTATIYNPSTEIRNCFFSPVQCLLNKGKWKRLYYDVQNSVSDPEKLY